MDIGNITLNNGEVVLIRDTKDLLYVVKKYLSHDIANELEEYFLNIDEEIASLVSDIEELHDEIAEAKSGKVSWMIWISIIKEVF